MHTRHALHTEATGRSYKWVVLGMLAALGLAACGGGNNNDPQQPATGIGPAGGTVTGSNGATIVVPAGALSQTVDLRITAISAGAANVPAGVQPASAIYALTPHGTTFASPVTVTVPFDPAQVAAGLTLYALKTSNTARTAWDVLEDLSVDGTNASVQLTSFSDFLLTGIGPPIIVTQPVSVSVEAGQSATFSVVANANGSPWIDYQWQRNGVALAGATGPSYTLANAALGDDGARFLVIVRNWLGEVGSSEATLSVGPAGPGGLDLTGNWSNDYSCTTNTGEVFSDTEIITAVQTGTSVSLTSGDFTGTGTLAGEVMTYSGSGPGYTETGTWTRDGSDDRFAKASTYTNSPEIGGSGTCTGTLQRIAADAVLALAAGGTSGFAVKGDGTLWAWGWNRHGELGLGAEMLDQRVLVPTQVGTATNWRTVTASPAFALALRSDGTLWGWGGNSAGQLGDGSSIARFSPTRIGTADNWSAVAAGGRHAVALRRDGTLWAWGFNAQGQLGDGTTEPRPQSTRIGTDTDWLAIAAGLGHTLALKRDGSLWAWGDNTHGQLGDGTTTVRLTPTRIGAAGRWTAVAAGQRFTLAVNADGSLWGWGDNEAGQLGDGTLSARLAPTRVGGDNDWVGAAAGWWQTSMGLKADGSLWGWGHNHHGELGNGTVVNASTPLRVGASGAWSGVAIGMSQVLGRQADGVLWAWGANPHGELGDGTRDGRLTPTKVSF